MDFFTLAIPIVLVAVLAVLLTGIASMVKGGDFNRKYGNLLMRLRVGIQFFAVALIALAFFMTR